MKFEFDVNNFRFGRLKFILLICQKKNKGIK